MKNLLTTLLNIFTVATFALLVSIMGLLVMTQRQDSQTFIVNGPISILIREIRVGEIGEVKLDYCLQDNDPIIIKRGLIEEGEPVSLDLTLTPLLLEKGCRIVSVVYKIPQDLKPGTYSATLYIVIPTLDYGEIFKTNIFEITL